MRGVVFVGERELEIRDYPDPTPGPGEVIVAVKASGMCGSDLHSYREPKSVRRPDIQADCARFVADHKLPLGSIFTPRFTLDQADEAYKLFDTQTTGKGVFLFD